MPGRPGGAHRLKGAPLNANSASTRDGFRSTPLGRGLQPPDGGGPSGLLSWFIQLNYGTERRVAGRQLQPSRSLGRCRQLRDRDAEVASNREIAEALGASEGTIKNQASSIFSKLGVRDRTRAVLKALELGCI